MTFRRNQVSHDSMVRKVADHLVQNGFSSVKADLPNWQQPETIVWTHTQQGHRPDVTGVQNGQTFIFEIETEDTIKIEHTSDQWKLFSAFTKTHNAHFYVVVPNGFAGVARQQLMILRLQANILEA